MKILFVAEKNSQCESLMNTFEPRAKKYKGYWEGDRYIFTHAVGHLYRLKMHDFAKDISELPYLFDSKDIRNPIKYYEAGKKTLSQLKVVNNQLKRSDISEIICATDPDAEGEAIYRTIVESANISSRIKQTRLIIRDTTEVGLKKQFEMRKPCDEYEGLRQKAYARALTDYTLGINLSQAMSIKTSSRFSVGRVQTPVLKMIIDRYNQNKNYKKTIHYELKLLINDIEINESNLKFKTIDEAKYFISSMIGKKLQFDSDIKQVQSTPPALYDLANIQKYGIDKLNISANKVLDIVQVLYEKKLVTYPRTDCQKITNETADNLNKFFGKKVFGEIKLNSNLSKTTVGDTTAHEGLTLTPQEAVIDNLSKEELIIYTEIKNRFLANYLDNAIAKQLELKHEGSDMQYKAVFCTIIHKGYIELYNDKPFKNMLSMNELEQITKQLDVPIEISEKNLAIREVVSTRPALYTESTIITKMQNIHSEIEDGNLKKVSKKIEGIGTPATRGSIIDNLFKQNYIEKKGKGLIPTEKGRFLIDELEKQGNPLINVEYTAILEHALSEIENSQNIEEYFVGLNEFTEVVVNKVKNANIQKQEEKSYGICPKCMQGKIIKRNGNTGSFYPCNQKECDYSISGFYKFNDSDIEKLLSGSYSSIKTLKSKDGNPYKAKFMLEGEKLKREFINTKSNNKNIYSKYRSKSK